MDLDENLFKGLFSYEFTIPSILETLHAIRNSVVLINKITYERDIHINIERTVTSHSTNSTIFPKSLQNHNQLFYIRILTEAYFIYTKNLLDKCSKLLYILHKDEIGTVKNDGTNFGDIFHKIIDNNESEEIILKYIKNDMRWYEIYLSIPRTLGIIHDMKSTHEVYADHYYDYYYSKENDYEFTDVEKIFLKRMYDEHSVVLEEEYDDAYPIRTARSLMRYYSVLTDSDYAEFLKILKHKKIFPYIADLNWYLSEFFKKFQEDICKKLLPNPHYVSRSEPKINWAIFED